MFCNDIISQNVHNVNNLKKKKKNVYKVVDKLKQLWYYSITAFAEAIGWSRNKASRIINGMQEPSCDDIVDLTNVLDLGEKEFFAIFFDKLSTMCTD
jgi:hypothetical protein